MAQEGKLRVALEDRDDALQVVTSKVHDATGFTAEPEFQELDQGGELLIELRLRDAGGFAPSDLARMVTSGTTGVEVLSAWSEPAAALLHCRLKCDVIDLLQSEVPDVALRAHRDGVPTARWQPPLPAQAPHWLLAVPGFRADRRAVVGICRRSGYHYRFSASEARSIIPEASAGGAECSPTFPPGVGEKFRLSL